MIYDDIIKLYKYDDNYYIMSYYYFILYLYYISLSCVIILYDMIMVDWFD